jgi:hypothetical protein
MNNRKTRLTNTLIFIAAGLFLTIIESATAQPLQPDFVDDFTGKPRVVVLTDMGNEPDDQMSFVPSLVIFQRTRSGGIDRYHLHLAEEQGPTRDHAKDCCGLWRGEVKPAQARTGLAGSG